MRLVLGVTILSAVAALLGCGTPPAHPLAEPTIGNWEGDARKTEPATSLPQTTVMSAPNALAPKPCPSGGGRDFTADVQRLFRVVACPSSGPPSDVDAKAVEAHCSDMRRMMRAHKRGFVDVASPFLSNITDGSPDKVVYAFSGGDLVTALTTYPRAHEITTISLELAGDPAIRMGMASNLAVSLDKLRREAGEVLINEQYSRSETLKSTQSGTLPGALSMFLIGLAVHGYEPVELRYFTLEHDGSVRYLNACDRTTFGGSATRRKSTWHSPDFAEAFAHSELRFRRAGDPNAMVHVHRHIAANLNNMALQHFGELVAHLEAKGEVSTMIKAASYLLWRDDFSQIRTYLLDHLKIMVSDSTGLPPDFASSAKLEQETYGHFAGALLPAREIYNRSFRALWKSQPKRSLAFRFGYLSKGMRHLVVTRRPAVE